MIKITINYYLWVIMNKAVHDNKRIMKMISEYIDKCKKKLTFVTGKEAIFYAKCIENAEELRLRMLEKIN